MQVTVSRKLCKTVFTCCDCAYKYETENDNEVFNNWRYCPKCGKKIDGFCEGLDKSEKGE